MGDCNNSRCRPVRLLQHCLRMHVCINMDTSFPAKPSPRGPMSHLQVTMGSSLPLPLSLSLFTGGAGSSAEASLQPLPRRRQARTRVCAGESEREFLGSISAIGVTRIRYRSMSDRPTNQTGQGFYSYRESMFLFCKKVCIFVSICKI